MILTFMQAASEMTGMGASAHLDPVKLFLHADIVVKLVIVGLIMASVWTWAIIFSFALRLRKIASGEQAFDREFWQAADHEIPLKEGMRRNLPAARVAGAGVTEWMRSTKGKVIDKEALRQRLTIIMDNQVAEETDALAAKLTFLATVGSVSPFVGLFGTVWGIMNSFFQIGAQQNSTLAVVAPGISEALFATAIGLFAAIPAVIAYNRLSTAIGSYEARLHRFSDKLMTNLSRQLERL